MSRRWLAAGVALAIASTTGSLAPLARGSGAETSYYVNTTQDVPFDMSHCGKGQPCPLRSAIALADGVRGVVRACYDPAEVGGGPGCPAGAEPLRRSDPGYDADTGKWTVRLDAELSALEILTGGVKIDFTRDVGDWSDPSDNRIVVAGEAPEQKYGLFLEAGDNVVSGLDLRGTFAIAALDVRLGASRNQLGPGLVLAGIEPGVGLRIRDTDTRGNRLVGSWCGISGDGTRLDPVHGDCVRITLGASENVIGGTAPGDRNVFAATGIGAGVAVDADKGSGTRDNAIQGNWIGLDATGAPAGAEVGVRVSLQAANTRIVGNTIGGNRSDGILVSDIGFGTVIEENRIGTDALGESSRSNGGYGIRLQNGPKGSLIKRNTVAHNRSGGVLLTGATTLNNQVTENRITDNGGRGIQLAQGANLALETPQILQVTETSVIGRACGGCTIEVFSDPGVEAEAFEGRASSDVATGVFVFSKAAATFRHGNVTVTGTDINRNTSALSPAKPLPGRPTPTRSATATRPAPPTPTGGYAIRVLLPRVDHGAGN